MGSIDATGEGLNSSSDTQKVKRALSYILKRHHRNVCVCACVCNVCMCVYVCTCMCVLRLCVCACALNMVIRYHLHLAVQSGIHKL